MISHNRDHANTIGRVLSHKHRIVPAGHLISHNRDHANTIGRVLSHKHRIVPALRCVSTNHSFRIPMEVDVEHQAQGGCSTSSGCWRSPCVDPYAYTMGAVCGQRALPVLPNHGWRRILWALTHHPCDQLRFCTPVPPCCVPWRWALGVGQLLALTLQMLSQSESSDA